MKPLLAVFFLFALALPSWARLGETERELIARFGQPTARAQHSIVAQGKIIPLGPQLHFREGDWQITCDMIDGRCLRISYGKRGDWTEEQFRTVLTANSQGSRWTDTSDKNVTKVQRSWRRSDGSDARWMTGTGMTLTWDAYNKAKAKAEERARVEASRKPRI